MGMEPLCDLFGFNPPGTLKTTVVQLIKEIAINRENPISDISNATHTQRPEFFKYLQHTYSSLAGNTGSLFGVSLQGSEQQCASLRLFRPGLDLLQTLQHTTTNNLLQQDASSQQALTTAVKKHRYCTSTQISRA